MVLTIAVICLNEAIKKRIMLVKVRVQIGSVLLNETKAFEIIIIIIIIILIIINNNNNNNNKVGRLLEGKRGEGGISWNKRGKINHYGKGMFSDKRVQHINAYLPSPPGLQSS